MYEKEKEKERVRKSRRKKFMAVEFSGVSEHHYAEPFPIG